MATIQELLSGPKYPAESAWFVKERVFGRSTEHHFDCQTEAEQFAEKLMDASDDPDYHVSVYKGRVMRRKTHVVTYIGGSRPMIPASLGIAPGEFFLPTMVDPDRDDVMQVCESQDGDIDGMLDVERVHCVSPSAR